MAEELVLSYGYSDTIGNFTGRQEIIASFEQLLATAQPASPCHLAIKGPSGIGKTFLTSYLRDQICPRAGWQSALLSFSPFVIPDFDFILHSLEPFIFGCVPQEQKDLYLRQRDDFQRRFNIIHNSPIEQNVTVGEYGQASQITLSVNLNDLNKQRKRLRSEWGNALTELLAQAERSFCLFIDNYELLESDYSTGDEAAPADELLELANWLYNDIIPALAAHNRHSTLVVSGGWKYPTKVARRFDEQRFVELSPFTREQVQTYLEKQEILARHVYAPNTEQGELLDAFYQLSQGHPLVLGIARAYFSNLAPNERNISSLRITQVSKHPDAMHFLEAGLRRKLSEPYRTLLEWAPLLRSFNRHLLNLILAETQKADGKAEITRSLDEQAYKTFLIYPFITPIRQQADDLLYNQPIFHDLFRRVCLESLRQEDTPAPLKTVLHEQFASYYEDLLNAEINRLEAEEEQQPANAREVFSADPRRWIPHIPEQFFKALIELLYHSFQLNGKQEEALRIWVNSVDVLNAVWQYRHVALLLDVVYQLIDEGEPFFHSDGQPYAIYLQYHVGRLMQEGHWTEAKKVEQKAVDRFVALGLFSSAGAGYNTLAEIYQTQGDEEQALDCYQKAFEYFERDENLEGQASAINNSTAIYLSRGEIEFARQQTELVRPLFMELGRLGQYATAAFASNNAAVIYEDKDPDLALTYYREALEFYEKAQDTDGYAFVLSNIGGIYEGKGQLEQALDHYLQALEYVLKTKTTKNILFQLKRIGNIYRLQKKYAQALKQYQQAIPYIEQTENISDIYQLFEIIADLYNQLNQWQDAVACYERVLRQEAQHQEVQIRGACLNKLGHLYLDHEQDERALGYFEQELSLAKKERLLHLQATALNTIGRIYQKRGSYGEAVEYYEQALIPAQQAEYALQIGHAYKNIASAYREQGWIDNALSDYQRALASFRKTDDLDETAICLNSIGDILQYKDQIDQALVYYEEAYALLEKTEHTRTAIEALFHIGRIYSEQRKWQESLTAYQSALDREDNPQRSAIILTGIGELYQKLEQWPLALETYLKALPIIDKQDQALNKALFYRDLGDVYAKLDKLIQALNSYEKACIIFEEEHEVFQVIAISNIMGEISRRRSEWEQAFEHYEHALSLSEGIGDQISQADSLYLLGELQFAHRLYKQSLVYHERALVIRERLSDGKNIILSCNALGNAHEALRAWRTAYEFYERALHRAELENQTALAALALNNISNIWYIYGHIDYAIDFAEQALTLRKKDKKRSAIAASYNNLGELYRFQGWVNQALAYHQQALELWQEEKNMAAVALSLNNISAIYYAVGDLSQALQSLEESVEVCKDLDLPLLLATLYNNIGSLYHSQQQLAPALQAYQHALAAIRQMQYSLEAAIIYQHIGDLWYAQENWQEAIDAYDRSMRIYERLGEGNELDIATVLDYLAACFTFIGDLEKSQLYSERAKKLHARFTSI